MLPAHRQGALLQSSVRGRICQDAVPSFVAPLKQLLAAQHALKAVLHLLPV